MELTVSSEDELNDDGDHLGEANLENSDQPDKPTDESFVLGVELITDEQFRRYRRQMESARQINQVMLEIESYYDKSKGFLQHKLKQVDDIWVRFYGDHEDIMAFATVEDRSEEFHTIGIFDKVNKSFSESFTILHDELNKSKRQQNGHK